MTDRADDGREGRNLLILPRDRPGDATYASLAAQIEAGLVTVIQDRRAIRDRRIGPSVREHGQRATQRRQTYPYPVPMRMVLNPQ